LVVLNAAFSFFEPLQGAATRPPASSLRLLKELLKCFLDDPAPLPRLATQFAKVRSGSVQDQAKVCPAYSKLTADFIFVLLFDEEG
jgi:hypothetical protein